MENRVKKTVLQLYVRKRWKRFYDLRFAFHQASPAKIVRIVVTPADNKQY